MFCESSAHGTGLLGSQILGPVLLVLVELPQVLLLCLMNDGKDASYRLAHNVAEK